MSAENSTNPVTAAPTTSGCAASIRRFPSIAHVASGASPARSATMGIVVQQSQDRHFYEPRLGSGLPHSPLNAIIAPRPIGWISTQAADGILNLAPFSFFNAFSYSPPIIGFASNGEKDTLVNARSSGEFCWNLVSRELADAMNASSAGVAPSVDEFALAGLQPRPSRIVATPHVAAARAVMECRVSQIVTLRSAAGEETSTSVVFGEVVGVHIDRALLHEGAYQTIAADPVIRAGGPSAYYTLDAAHRFDMRRPDAQPSTAAAPPHSESGIRSTEP